MSQLAQTTGNLYHLTFNILFFIARKIIIQGKNNIVDSLGYPNVYSIGTHTHTQTFWFLCLYRKKTAHPLDVYCLFMEGSQLFTSFASQTLQQTPSLSFQKNIPSVVHFYPNRWSMLVLSEPSQGGKMWEKKGEKWFSYGVT